MLCSQHTLLGICDIFEVSIDGKLYGFGSGGKKLFKKIANILWSIHLSNSYCSNIEMQFYIIQPGLNVICLFTPIHTTDPYVWEYGINHDLLCFCSLVCRILDDHVDMETFFSNLAFPFQIYLLTPHFLFEKLAFFNCVTHCFSMWPKGGASVRRCLNFVRSIQVNLNVLLICIQT
jgi:hypothetical protein